MDLFGNIPFYILADRRLSDFDKLLFGYINGMCKAKGYFDETNKQVGDFFGKHPITVSSARQSLIKLGYVLCRGSVLTISENAKCISENTNEVSENAKAENKGVSENTKATLAKTLSPLSENANPISENTKHLREKNNKINKIEQDSEKIDLQLHPTEQATQQLKAEQIAERNVSTAKAELIEILRKSSALYFTQIMLKYLPTVKERSISWNWMLYELDKCINYYVSEMKPFKVANTRQLKATFEMWIARGGLKSYEEYKANTPAQMTQPQPIEPKKDIIVKTRPYAKVNRP